MLLYDSWLWSSFIPQLSTTNAIYHYSLLEFISISVGHLLPSHLHRIFLTSNLIQRLLFSTQLSSHSLHLVLTYSDQVSGYFSMILLELFSFLSKEIILFSIFALVFQN